MVLHGHTGHLNTQLILIIILMFWVFYSMYVLFPIKNEKIHGWDNSNCMQFIPGTDSLTYRSDGRCKCVCVHLQIHHSFPLFFPASSCQTLHLDLCDSGSQATDSCHLSLNVPGLGRHSLDPNATLNIWTLKDSTGMSWLHAWLNMPVKSLRVELGRTLGYIHWDTTSVPVVSFSSL